MPGPSPVWATTPPATPPTFLVLLAPRPLLVVVLLDAAHELHHAARALFALLVVEALAGGGGQLRAQLVVLQVQPAERAQLVETQRQVRELKRRERSAQLQSCSVAGILGRTSAPLRWPNRTIAWKAQTIL